MKKAGMLVLVFLLLSMKMNLTMADENSPESPMKIELNLPDSPALNQTAVLSCVVTSIVDAPDTTVEILLPEGLILVDGNLTWQGDIQKNESTEILVTIQAIKTGEWMIEARAKSMTGSDSWIGAREFLYIYITQQKGMASSQKIDPYYFESRKEVTIAALLLVVAIVIFVIILKREQRRGKENEN